MSRRIGLEKQDTPSMNISLPKLSIWGNFTIILFLVPLIGFPLHAIL